MNEIRSEILKHLEKNSKADLGELAILLGTDEISVANEIADMEKEGIICGYHTLIDWDKAGRGFVNALIEVRVTPQRERGMSISMECDTYIPGSSSASAISSAASDAFS